MAPEVKMHLVTAAEEYEKNPDLKKEDIDKLRSWVATEKHLPTTITDEMLILFHHSCYFDLERTKSCIETYYTMRTNNPDLFSNRDITKPDLAKSLDGLNYGELPTPDPNGYRIVFHGIRDSDSSKYFFVDGVKLLFMTFDSCFLNHGTMPGFIVVFDMQRAKLSHLTRINVSVVRKFFQYIQEANPVRLKAIHVVNVVTWMDKVLSLIKPFMKKELNSLLHLHTNLEEFYKVVPKDCLPKDLGGNLQSIDEINAAHAKVLEGLRDYFAEQEKIRVDESKRDKKKKNKNNKLDETELEFEKLEID